MNDLITASRLFPYREYLDPRTVNANRLKWCKAVMYVQNERVQIFKRRSDHNVIIEYRITTNGA